LDCGHHPRSVLGRVFAVLVIAGERRRFFTDGEVQIATRHRDVVRIVHVAGSAADWAGIVTAVRGQLGCPLLGIELVIVELVIEGAVPVATARLGDFTLLAVGPGKSLTESIVTSKLQ
jgi:hypothetical protein